MSETRFTPGEWMALPEEMNKPYIRIRGTRLGGRFKIANVLDVVYDGVPDYEVNETRANARLIAAAPDLYAACQRILAHIDDVKSDDDLMECRRLLAAALTKANPPAKTSFGEITNTRSDIPSDAGG